MDTNPTPLEKAVLKAGSQAKLADAIGKTQQLVSYWLRNAKTVPAEDAIKIETATGISRHELRPDIFGREGEAA